MGPFDIFAAPSLGGLVSAKGVGDFVASGLGLARSTSETDAADATLSARPSTGALSLSTGAPKANVSVDECWSSWEDFWSWRHEKTALVSSPILTYTTSYVYTHGANASTQTGLTTTIDTTRTIDNGGFAISTQTIDTTSTSIYTQSAVPTETVTSKYTLTSFSTYKDKPTNTIARPTCRLPKLVSQCQEDWEGWIDEVLSHPTVTPPPGCDLGAGFMNGRTVPPCASSYNDAQDSYYTWQQSQSAKMPVCSQASISGELCESIRDEYVQMKANWFAPPDYATAFFFSAGYLGTFENVTAGNMQPSYYWPTSQTLSPAPSCTVGCGRCAVTGGTVDVLYWPSQTATEGPVATAPMTLETLGTTLTSPTVYISYSNLYASNGCSGVGSTITSTIVPIPIDQTLSSVYAGTIACDAHFRMTQVWTATASFNFADLATPVPYSIYSSQPWCQTYLRNQGCQGTCPTEAPYKPIVVVPPDVLQQLQPEWQDCFGDIRGAYDPPKALRPIATAPGPSSPDPTGTGAVEPTTSTPATPADGLGSTTPTPTAGYGTGHASDTNSGHQGGDASPTNQHGAGGEGTSTQDAEGTGDAGEDTPTQGAGNHDSDDQGSAAGDSDGDGSQIRPTPTGSSEDESNGDQASSDQDTAGYNGDQNPGGVIASLLGAAGNSGEDDAAAAATTTMNVGGVVASLLGSGHAVTTTATAESGPSDEDSESGDGQAAVSEGGTQSVRPSGAARPDSSSQGRPGGEQPPSGFIATMGSEVVTIVSSAATTDAKAAVGIVQDGSTASLLPGDATQIGGQTVSMARHGKLIYGSGNDKTTVRPSNGPASSTIAVIGSESVTIVPASGTSSVAVLDYDDTRTTLAIGATATINGVRLTLDSEGGLESMHGVQTTTSTQGGGTSSSSMTGASSVSAESVPEATGNHAEAMSMSRILLISAVGMVLCCYV